MNFLSRKYQTALCSSVCNREFCDSVVVTAAPNFLSHRIPYVTAKLCLYLRNKQYIVWVLFFLGDYCVEQLNDK